MYGYISINLYKSIFGKKLVKNVSALIKIFRNDLNVQLESWISRCRENWKPVLRKEVSNLQRINKNGLTRTSKQVVFSNIIFIDVSTFWAWTIRRCAWYIRETSYLQFIVCRWFLVLDFYKLNIDIEINLSNSFIEGL